MPLLDRVVVGPQNRTRRLLVYGMAGVGKSTFAAGSDKPIFLDCENRTEHLNVARLVINGWVEFLKVMAELLELRKKPDIPYNTIVVDTLDALELMIHQYLCAKEGVQTIDEYGGGYGKGYTATIVEWGRFTRATEALRDAGYQVVLLAHSQVKLFKDPEGMDYDKYQLKMNDKSSAYIRERVDAVGFACFDDYGKKARGEQKAKGITGDRVLKFLHSAAYESKKGTSEFPDQCDLNWQAYAEACGLQLPA